VKLARALLSAAAMTHRERGAALFLFYVFVVACGNGSSDSRMDENVNRDEACREAQNDRDEVLLVIDLDGGASEDGGDAGDAAADACVRNCPGVIPDASFSDPAQCQAQCMERAARQRLSDPKFVGCHDSPQSIGCMFDVSAPKPCDLVTR
jgi:hypothetical protein